MSSDYHKKKRPSGASPRPVNVPKSAGRWKTPLLWFMAGLLTGAGSMGLIWIDHRNPPTEDCPTPSTNPALSDTKQQTSDKPQKNKKNHGHRMHLHENTHPEEPTPHFDFYNLLPAGSSDNNTAVVHNHPNNDHNPVVTNLKTNEHPNPIAANTTKKLIIDLQCGSYKTQEEADAVRARILLLGLNAHIRPVQLDNQQQRFRIFSGPFHNEDEVHPVRQRLHQADIDCVELRRLPH